MPLVTSTSLDILTPQMILDQVNALETRLGNFSADYPITPRMSDGIRTERYPFEQHWWPRSDHQLGYPSQFGWDAVYGERRHISAYKHPCILTVEQLHDAFQKINDTRYQQK